MMNTTELDALLDDLATTTDLNVMEKTLEETQISVVGIVDITHTFGKISDFTVSLDEEDHDFHDEVTEAIEEDVEDELLLDDIILYETTTESARWFLLPIEDGGISTRTAIMVIDKDEFDPQRWAKFMVDKDTPVLNEIRGYDNGHVTSLVKMVNAGENATDIVDTLDLAAEEEEEVLHFRAN